VHGTLINMGTVAAGTAIGRAGGARLPERISRTITNGLGLFTVVLGVSGALRTFERGKLSDAIVVLVGIVLGGMAGSALRIEARIERAGERLRTRLGSGEPGFAEGFLVASLVFCVGPLTVLGSLRDGLNGDAGLLSIKAVLDGFAALALAARFGIGVAASLVTIVIYQGGLTMGASVFRDVFTPDVLRGLDAAGGLLILGIGLRLLDVRDVKIGDFLPALVLVPVGAWLVSVWP
jgi:hypothetical protein